MEARAMGMRDRLYPVLLVESQMMGNRQEVESKYT